MSQKKINDTKNIKSPGNFVESTSSESRLNFPYCLLSQDYFEKSYNFKEISNKRTILSIVHPDGRELYAIRN